MLQTALIFLANNRGFWSLDHTILLQDLRFNLLQAQPFCLGNIEDHKHKGDHCYDPKQEKYILWPKEFLW
jgi:hypothetical protein